MISTLFGRLWAVTILILFFAPVGTGAVSSTRLINCLKSAQRVQLSSYKEKKEYILDQKLLLEKLTPGCAELTYSVSKTTKGFRVSSSLNGESWEIDNFDNLTKLSGGSSGLSNSTSKQSKSKSEKSADSPDTPAASSEPKSVASSSGFPKPLTERTDRVPKAWAPTPGSEQSEPPKVSSSTDPEADKDAKGETKSVSTADAGPDTPAKEPREDKTEDADDVTHLRVCFAKTLAQTAACRKTLADAKSKCADGKDDSEICVTYRAQFSPPPKTKVPKFVSDAMESTNRQPSSTGTMRRAFEQMNALSGALQTLLLEMAQRMSDLESQNSQLRKDNEKLRNSLETLQSDVKAIKAKAGDK